MIRFYVATQRRPLPKVIYKSKYLINAKPKPTTEYLTMNENMELDTDQFHMTIKKVCKYTTKPQTQVKSATNHLRLNRWYSGLNN